MSPPCLPRRIHAGWLLAGVCLLAFLVRLYFWKCGYGQGGGHGLLIHGDGYWDMAKALSEKFPRTPEHWRAAQILYPLYLLPLFLGGLDPGNYVFWLHQGFAIATCLLLFATGRILGGDPAGLLAALGYALHLQIAFWFNFTLADTCFQFHAALFGFLTLRLIQGGGGWGAWLLSGLALGFTRPEGLVVWATAFAYFGWLRISKKLVPVILLPALGLALLLAGVGGVQMLKANSKVQEAAFSHVQVAVALYYGSLRTPTQAAEVDRALNSMYAYGAARANQDPQKRNMWYWISQAGWERIRSEPRTYLGNLAARVPNVLFPSFYREGVSIRYKVFDRGMGFFLLAGVGFALIWRTRSQVPFRILVGLAAVIYACVTLIQSEWDVRVQLSAHVLLLPVAASGWSWAWQSALRERSRRHRAISPPPANPGKTI